MNLQVGLLLGLVLALALFQPANAAATCCGVIFTASAVNVSNNGGGIASVDVDCDGASLKLTLITAPACPAGDTYITLAGTSVGSSVNITAPLNQLLSGPTCNPGISVSAPWTLQNSSGEAVPFSASFTISTAAGTTCAAAGCAPLLQYGAMQQLAAGASYGHTCGQAIGGAWWCWGDNSVGELANGVQSSSLVLSPVAASYVPSNATLVVGHNLSCAVLPAGTVQCWGSILRYATPPKIVSGEPVLGSSGTESLSNVVAVSLGATHSCALLGDGSVVCWGSRYYGNLGDGNMTNDLNTYVNPVIVQAGPGAGPLENVVAVTAGDSHTCALLGNASVVCWGYVYGSESMPYPQLVSGLSNVVNISAGDSFTCAIVATRQMWCWGASGGELGGGSIGGSVVPVLVSTGPGAPLQNVAGMVTSAQYEEYSEHACAWLSNGTAYCWGGDSFNELGDGGASGTSSSTPVTVLQQPGGQPLSGVEAMAVTAQGACALLGGGAISCWGNTSYPSGAVVPGYFVDAGSCRLSLELLVTGNDSPPAPKPILPTPSASASTVTVIVGGAVGGVGGAAALAALGYVLMRRRRLHGNSKTTLMGALFAQDTKGNEDVERCMPGGDSGALAAAPIPLTPAGGRIDTATAEVSTRHAQELQSAASGSAPWAATSAPVTNHSSGPLGAQGLGGGLALKPTAGSGPVTGSVEVVLAVSVLAVCTQLALAIVDAADRVVANHARCRRLVGRVARMQPLLERLKSGQIERPMGHAHSLEAQLQHIRSILEDVRSCVTRWCSGSGSMVAVVKNLVTSHWYQVEFVDLNTQLSEAHLDLCLVLGIQGGEANGTEKMRVAVEAQNDLSTDMRQLAEDLTTNTELWSELDPEQLRVAYAAQGLDLDELARQARRDVVRRKVKDLYIPLKDVELLEVVGAGGFGTVHRARWQGCMVAVKELSKSMLAPRAQRSLEHEGYIMSITRHPNVAQFYGLIVEPGLCALVMRYYARGSLLQLLHDDSCSLAWVQRCRLALDVARGMDHLHSRPFESIIHGDLKSSNLLVTEEGSVVISDFGLSRVPTLTKTMTGLAGVGSMCYMAPELIANPMHALTIATDVYSFSMVMYELATGRMPFDEAKTLLVAHHVREGGRPPVPENVPVGYAQLMCRCWAQKPEDRPAFSDIVQSLISLIV